MGFAEFATPYRWERIAPMKRTASAHPDGMIDLSVGSPVDPTPDAVRRALASASDAPNAHGYPVTVGTGVLRAAISGWFSRWHGFSLESIGAGFVPSVGSKEAVALMASLLGLGPGDVVVQPAVSYPTYEIGTQLAGASTLKVDVTDVASWVSHPGVKLVWVNSPCNPTGEILPAETMRRIVEAARSIGAVVVSDECYALMDWRGDDDSVAPSVLSPSVSGGSLESVLCLYSLSKQSNMAGYRTAFIAGDPDIITPMIEQRKQIGLIIPGPVQAAMAAGLDDDQAVVVQKARYRRRLNALVEGLRAAGYDAAMPDGALYVWTRAKSGDCWKDMEWLAGLGIIASPGEFYGDPTSLRFSSTATDAAVDGAVARLHAAA